MYRTKAAPGLDAATTCAVNGVMDGPSVRTARMKQGVSPVIQRIRVWASSMVSRTKNLVPLYLYSEDRAGVELANGTVVTAPAGDVVC